MSTSTKVAVIAAGTCLIAWVIKKLADQRAHDYPLPIVNLIREKELHKPNMPQPEASQTSGSASDASEAEGSETIVEAPTEPEATTPQAAP